MKKLAYDATRGTEEAREFNSGPVCNQATDNLGN